MDSVMFGGVLFDLSMGVAAVVGALMVAAFAWRSMHQRLSALLVLGLMTFPLACGVSASNYQLIRTIQKSHLLGPESQAADLMAGIATGLQPVTSALWATAVVLGLGALALSVTGWLRGAERDDVVAQRGGVAVTWAAWFGVLGWLGFFTLAAPGDLGTSVWTLGVAAVAVMSVLGMGAVAVLRVRSQARAISWGELAVSSMVTAAFVLGPSVLLLPLWWLGRV